MFAAIGYFVYGGPDGAVAVFILSIVLAIASFLGLIPVAGPIIYAALSYKWIIPKVLSMAEISGSKLTGFIFVFYLFMAVLYTILIGIALE